jgi:hypothetical protein
MSCRRFVSSWTCCARNAQLEHELALPKSEHEQQERVAGRRGASKTP